MITTRQLKDDEDQIRKIWEDGEIPYLTHLAGGNEDWLADFFHSNIKPDDWVLASHRCHFQYTLHGGLDVIGKVLSGKSMFLYGPRFLCSAIVAGSASIAAGLALSIHLRGGKERVWCFVGDGAEDEGNFYEAVRFVHGRSLPCTFIIEDNNSSCGVTKAQRGSPDDWQWPDCVIRHRFTPQWPHAGSLKRPKLKRQTP